jgi:dienelactone hydrolase
VRNTYKVLLAAGLTLMSLVNVNGQSDARKASIRGEEVTYKSDSVMCKAYIAYDASVKGKRPAILVVPEWWGCNAYVRRRADMLAGLGYIAMAVDMYGEGKLAATPSEAQKLATPFYTNPKLGQTRLEAAERKLKEQQEANPGRVGAIGYCFGGAMVLDAAKMGADYAATVSFHGGLDGVPATKGSVRGRILVCHGADDKFVDADEVKKFRTNLDSLKINYSFRVYAGATHAFTNPDATANGKKFNIPIAYNEKADQASWAEMKQFLSEIFFKK